MSAVVLRGDARRLPLPDGSVDLIVTSPPYFGLRSYTDGGEHYDGQIGSEATPAAWVAALVECTREWMRVLKPSGSIFVNLGDKYAGSRMDGSSGWDSAPLDHDPKKLKLSQLAASQGKLRTSTTIPTKSLLGLPWRYAIACTDQIGLILRAEIIWAKPNGLPESVTDRVRRSHEQLFHLVKQPRYYAAVDEIREPHAGTTHPQNPRPPMQSGNGVTHRISGMDSASLNPMGKLPGSVWTIPSQPLTVPAGLGVDHFAAFPMELPRRIVLGWSPPGICTVCGEGRRPVVDKQLVGVWHDKPPQDSHYTGREQQHLNNRKSEGDRMMHTFGSTAATITGYACGCDTVWPNGAVQPSTRPAVVLDPFGGTGTTALVASAYGRTGISVDRSADYCRLAAWRTTDPGQRAAALQLPKPPPVSVGQLELFAPRT